MFVAGGRVAAAAGIVATLSGTGYGGVANASPNCYETGPGYEKCVVGGDYFNPIYQGPKLPDGFVPWVPSLPPVSAPTPAPIVVPNVPAPASGCPAGTYVDPANFSACLPATAGNDFVSLAISPSNPSAAAFGTATSQVEADRIAVAQCVTGTNSACVVAANAHHACAQVAVNAAGVVTNGIGPDLNSAASAALNAAPGGRLLVGHCADPPGN